MNYHSMYRSNEVKITNKEAIQSEVLEATVLPEVSDNPEDAIPKYELDGRVHFEDDDVMWLGSTGATFGVWSFGGENVTEEFLEDLSEYLEEELVIRSVGYTGLRHLPDAYQYRVFPDGEITIESLEP